MARGVAGNGPAHSWPVASPFRHARRLAQCGLSVGPLSSNAWPQTIPMRIAIEPANQPEVLALIQQLDEYQRPLYPAESHHGIDISALSQPNVIFAVARDELGHSVACGAIVLEPGYGELKRMFTIPSHRGRGIARSLLQLLEAEAQARGCNRFMLETGYLQPEAISLYERLGYSRRGPFGSYTEDPNSVFMHKSAPRASGTASAHIAPPP